MKEIWKDVKGYEGLYHVSNYGEVKSFKRQKVIILKPGVSCNGYKIVVLFKDKTRKSKTVHRLVLSAFIPNPENKSGINHEDGNKINNHLNNLTWSTQKENIRHAMENNLMDWSNSPKGELCGRSKLKTEDVKNIKRELLDKHRTYKEIGADYNISSTAIHFINIGRTWAHVSI